MRSPAPLLRVNSPPVSNAPQADLSKPLDTSRTEPSDKDSRSSRASSCNAGISSPTFRENPSEGHLSNPAPSSTQLRSQLEEAQSETNPQSSTDIESTLEHALPVRPVSDFLEEPSASLLEDFKVPEAIVSRWGDAFDIVTSSSTRCCCFTKSYVKYAKGTGSIIATTPRGMWQDRHVADEKGIVNGGASFDQASGRLVDLAALNLRFFTPREVRRLISDKSSRSSHVPKNMSVSILQLCSLDRSSLEAGWLLLLMSSFLAGSNFPRAPLKASEFRAEECSAFQSPLLLNLHTLGTTVGPTQPFP